jgi:hypothetical protein
MNNLQFTIYKKFGFSLFIVCCLLFVGVNHILAQTNAPINYNLLAPIPLEDAGGKATNQIDVSNPAVYISGLFKLIIGLAGGLAVVMIIYGGIIYMSTDAFNQKNEARGIIENAIWGLLLAISSWLILNTINPELLNMNLDIKKLDVATTNITPPTPPVGGTTPSPGGGGGACLNCTTLTLPMGSKSCAPNPNNACQINSELNSRLTSLHRQIPLVVTEAYPPTQPHQAPCHSNGTCVDVRAVADNQVYNFINNAEQVNLRAVFEVETAARKTAITNASCGAGITNTTCRNMLNARIAVLPPKDGKRQITAEHFSVYCDSCR